MTFNEFVSELKCRYPDYIGINHIDYDVSEAEHNEGEGDFIYEDSYVVIGKYIHCLKLFKPGSDEYDIVQFCVYGLGYKDYTSVDDYELASYESFEYLFV